MIRKATCQGQEQGYGASSSHPIFPLVEPGILAVQDAELGDHQHEERMIRAMDRRWADVNDRGNGHLQ